MLPTAPWRNRIVAHGEEVPGHLLANPANWRVHPPEQHRALAGALGQVGWVAQVVVNQRTSRLIDGHLRVELAIARGEPTVPVAYVDLDPEEEALVLATLDPLAAMATAEKDQLAALLTRLDAEDEGLRALLDDLAREHRLDLAGSGLVDPDAVPPIPDEPRVRPGEVWALGEHRLACGDAEDPATLHRLLDGAEPTLLVTDPPYGVSLDLATKGPRSRAARSEGHRNTSFRGDERVDWSAAFALVPSLRVGYVWHAGIHAAEVAAGLRAVGFDLVAQVIWEKGGRFVLGRGWYHWGHEPCWVVRRTKARPSFLGGRDQSTVWRAPSPKVAGAVEAAWDHPTQKPVLLYETAIANHLRPGEALYDPFCGSGTAIISAERLGRRCYAMDIDPRYVQVAIDRWQAFTGRAAERCSGGQADG